MSCPSIEIVLYQVKPRVYRARSTSHPHLLCGAVESADPIVAVTKLVEFAQEEGEIGRYIPPVDQSSLAERDVHGGIKVMKTLRAIHDALDVALGDTDPEFEDDTPDDVIRDEEPVFWAARELAGVIKRMKEAGHEQR